MEFTIVQCNESLARVAVSGRLDVMRAAALEVELNRLSARRLPVVMDLSGVEFIASLAIGQITVFIRGLAKEQEFLDNVTDSARIGDPEPLVKNLVVTDIVTASTGQGAVLACEGPQNSSTATILECVKPVSGNGAVDASGFNPHAGLAAERSHPVATAAVVGGFTMMGGLVGIGRRPRRARR